MSTPGETRVAVLSSVLALVLSLLAGQILILASGQHPAHVLGLLLADTWGSAYGVGQVLFKATPLVLTGLAVAIPFRAGLFNIGAEGQAVLGALATAVVGAHLPPTWPWYLGAPLAALAGAGVGCMWGLLPGFLKATRGAHEVITSIMLNFVALALANWLLASFLAQPETLHTAPLPPSARLPRLSEWVGSLTGSAANLSVGLGVLLALGSWAWLFHTTAGFRLRAVGLNSRAAASAGIRLDRVTLVAMGLGGAMAGLVGANFVQGYKGYFEEGFSGGVGFMGIAVALLGRNHPLWLLLAALLFGTLSQGGLAINAVVPKEIVEAMQALVILFVVASTSQVRNLLRDDPGRQGGEASP